MMKHPDKRKRLQTQPLPMGKKSRVFLAVYSAAVLCVCCIVQKVENGIIYTVEGNSGNLCRVNRYSVGQYEIMGYGVLRP